MTPKFTASATYAQQMIREESATVPFSRSKVPNFDVDHSCKTKRPPGNWAAFSSRENSSNGGLESVKTFCRNLMSLKTGVSSDFCEINAFVFSNLRNP